MLFKFGACTRRVAEWTGELGELERHLNLNPELSKKLVGCAFAEVACTHCRECFQRRHVHAHEYSVVSRGHARLAHETESCPQRPFSCDYCEDCGSVYEDIVNNPALARVQVLP